MDISRAR